MDTSERIIELIKQRGPLLPVSVSKEINENIILTSARLSELHANKKIKLTAMKIGGSPLYYLPSQEDQLQNFSHKLGQREQEAYLHLKGKKVVADENQEPVVRVALRVIKDFAVPLEVQLGSQVKIFWKYYLTTTEEASQLIKSILEEKDAATSGQEPKLQSSESVTKEKKEQHTSSQKQLPNPEAKITATLQEPKQHKERKKKEASDAFLHIVQSYLTKNNIIILETQEIKKNTEFNFIVQIESKIGPLPYFCKAKDKKKTIDMEIIAALMQAQTRGLPLLLLVQSSPSPKLLESIPNGANIVIRHI